MPTLEPIVPHVLPLMLIVARLTGLFIFTPLLNSATIPVVFRALLAFMLAVALYSGAPPIPEQASIDVVQLVPLLFAELMVGIVIGLIAMLPLYALQMGGYIMGYQMGLALAESFNPELDTNGSVIGQMLFFFAVFLYIGAGGLDIVFLSLAESLRTAPIGMFAVPDIPLDAFVGIFSSGFELALRVAMPILAAVSMSQVAMGLVMKTMPQINIMSVGFAIQIVAGLLILTLLLHIVAEVATDEIDMVMNALTDWVSSLAPRPSVVGAGAGDG